MGSVLVGLIMVVGLVGVLVPLLPGTALILAAGLGSARWRHGRVLAEARRHGNGPPARRSTVQVLQAVGLGILAELAAGLLMVATWLVGLAVA